MPFLSLILSGASRALSSIVAFASKPPGIYIAAALAVAIAIWWSGERGYSHGAADTKTKFEAAQRLAEKDRAIAEKDAAIANWRAGWKRRGEQDAITAASDKRNAFEQGKLEGITKEIIRNVPIYVTQRDDDRCTLPWGFVRMLDAAGLGLSPSDLPNRSPEPDGADSGIPLSRAAALLAQDLGEAAALRARLLNAGETWDAQAKLFNDRKAAPK